MLNKAEFLKNAVVNTTKTIKVDAWGYEVKIRPLTIAESFEVYALISAFEKSKGKDFNSFIKGQIKAVSYALVEPAFSEDELAAIKDAKIFEGVSFIFNEISKMAGENTPTA